MSDDKLNSILKETNRSNSLHNNLNTATKLEEELQFWQEKVLELKLKKVKDDLEHNKNKTILDKEFEEEKQKNKILKSELHEVNEKKRKLMEESVGKISRLNDIRENIKYLETANTEMYAEFIQNTNYIKQLENPDNLLVHLLQFDRETLKTLCIKLNTVQKEKFMHFMMQQQYYNQMYFNQQQKGVYPPHFNNYNYIGGNGVAYQNPADIGEDDTTDNQN
jgi:hypothetical protein